jgi:hypothetical protein
MKKSQKLRESPWKKKTSSIIQVGFLFFLLTIASCAEQMPRHKETPIPTAQELDQRVALKIHHLLAIKSYPEAKKMLAQIKNTALKQSLQEKIRQDWGQDDILTATEELRKGLGIEALDKLESLRKRDPNFFRSHSGTIPNDLAETYLESFISSGKEFRALQESKSLFKLPKSLEKTIDTDAYIHLAKRRLDEGKDHYALLDIKKGLLIAPDNPELKKMKSILKKKENWLTEEGFRAYGNQHLRRAIRYWSDALLLSPGDNGLQKNITQAKEMLDRLKSLQRTEQVSKNPNISK